MRNVPISEIAAALGECLCRAGEDFQVVRPADIQTCGPGDMVWLRGQDPELVTLVNRNRPALAICSAAVSPDIKVPHIVAKNPRLAFIRAVNLWFVPQEEQGIHPTAILHPDAKIGARVTIGPYARVGSTVEIGDDCVIGSGVSLEGILILGRRCRIKANAVIGAAGFGFERDENGMPVHFPHVGNIVLEDDVWIGACSTIERATLGTTRLCANVKVDDLVQIGHNTTTGANTLIMANTVICGGVCIGRNCWIAPNSVIKQKVQVGDRVTVGLGAVVIRNVPDDQVVAGVPAKPLASNKDR